MQHEHHTKILVTNHFISKRRHCWYCLVIFVWSRDFDNYTIVVVGIGAGWIKMEGVEKRDFGFQKFCTLKYLMKMRTQVHSDGRGCAVKLGGWRQTWGEHLSELIWRQSFVAWACGYASNWQYRHQRDWIGSTSSPAPFLYWKHHIQTPEITKCVFHFSFFSLKMFWLPNQYQYSSYLPHHYVPLFCLQIPSFKHCFKSNYTLSIVPIWLNLHKKKIATNARWWNNTAASTLQR